MKKNLRDKFRDFLASEEGRVGVKAPIAAGITSGSLLLAQAMIVTDAPAHMTCHNDAQCGDGYACDIWWEWEWSPGLQDWLWIKHSECVPE